MTLPLLLLAAQTALLTVAPGESLQAALEASADGDTVLLLPGVHEGTGAHLGVLDPLRNGVTLMGDVDDPSSVILDGGGLDGSILVLDGSSGGIDASTRVSGITFRNGCAGEGGFGGGVLLQGASPVLYRCRFEDCDADCGGGVSATRGTPRIDDCSFERCSATSCGGGLFLYVSDASVTNCTFDSCSSSDDGGGIFCWHSSPLVANCAVTGCSAQDDGGGIHCYAFSDPEIAFCSFAGNTAVLTGSAVYIRAGSSPVLHDDIVAGNSGPAFYMQDGGEPSFSCNCVWGNEGGDWGNLPDPTGTQGNISADPLWTGSLLLSQTAAGQESDSPCLDSGSITAREAGLDWAFTRTDSLPDAGQADMGYHHGIHPSEPGSGWGPPGGPGMLAVFPNPCGTSFSLVPPACPGGIRIAVYDVSGRLLLSSGHPGGSSPVEIGPLPAAGLYVVEASSGDGTVLGRAGIVVTGAGSP